MSVTSQSCISLWSATLQVFSFMEAEQVGFLQHMLEWQYMSLLPVSWNALFFTPVEFFSFFSSMILVNASGRSILFFSYPPPTPPPLGYFGPDRIKWRIECSFDFAVFLAIVF